MNDFLKEMADILDEESVAVSDQLQSFDAWDSLAILSVIAMADSRYHISLTAQQVRTVGTIGELQALLGGGSTGKDA
jgi:acyl carrier protein